MDTQSKRITGIYRSNLKDSKKRMTRKRMSFAFIDFVFVLVLIKIHVMVGYVSPSSINLNTFRKLSRILLTIHIQVSSYKISQKYLRL